MSYSVFETTLARLLTDEKFLFRFFQNPEDAIKNLDLIADEREALMAMDRDELMVAARSFRKKRASQCQHKKPSLWSRLTTFRSSQL